MENEGKKTEKGIQRGFFINLKELTIDDSKFIEDNFDGFNLIGLVQRTKANWLAFDIDESQFYYSTDKSDIETKGFIELEKSDFLKVLNADISMRELKDRLEIGPDRIMGTKSYPEFENFSNVRILKSLSDWPLDKRTKLSDTLPPFGVLVVFVNRDEFRKGFLDSVGKEFVTVGCDGVFVDFEIASSYWVKVL